MISNLNKRLLVLTLFTLLISAQGSISQSLSLPRERINDRLYNRKTNQKITEEEMVKIFQAYPGIVLEKEFNKYGEVEKYFFNPDSIRTGRVVTRNEQNQIKPGEKFKEFVFKTVDQEFLESERLQGKWVLIRFEVFAKSVNERDLQTQIGSLSKLTENGNIIPIICFADNAGNVRSIWKDKIHPYKLVANGINFHEIYHIVRTPTSILIDPDGKVYKYYYPGDEIILPDNLSQQKNR